MAQSRRWNGIGDHAAVEDVLRRERAAAAVDRAGVDVPVVADHRRNRRQRVGLGAVAVHVAARHQRELSCGEHAERSHELAARAGPRRGRRPVHVHARGAREHEHLGGHARRDRSGGLQDRRDPGPRRRDPGRRQSRLVHEVVGELSDDAVDVANAEPGVGERAEPALEGDRHRVLALEHARLLGVEDPRDGDVVVRMRAHGGANVPVPSTCAPSRAGVRSADEVLHDLRSPGRVRHPRRRTGGHPQLRRAGGVRGGGGLRRRVGGRAPLAHRVLAHERARDLPHRGGCEDVTHPRRTRCRVHAVRVQPPGAGGRTRRDARHHLRRSAQPRRRSRRHRAGDVAVRRRPRAHHTAGAGGTDLPRPLLARGHHPVGLRPPEDPAPTRPPTPHGRAATGAAPPPSALPRLHQPRDRASRRAVRRRVRWCSGSAVPR